MAIFHLASILGYVHTITTVAEAAIANLSLMPDDPCASTKIPSINLMLCPLYVISIWLTLVHSMVIVVIVFDKRFVDCFLLFDFLKACYIFLAHIRFV